MKRSAVLLALSVVAVMLVVPTLLADVKTRERSTVRVEGFLGSFINRSLGGNEGIVATVSVKGNRMSRMDNNNGQIVDLAEEKVYSLDIRRKEYTVLTFAQMREQLLEAKKKLEEQARSMPQAEQPQADAAAKEFEYDVNVNETGQKKPIAGQDTRQVILTISMREKGKTIDESGGFVMTMDQWLGNVPALVELRDFQIRFFKAVYEGVFTGSDLQASNMLGAMIPGFAQASQRLATEAQKLQGSALMSTTTFESVKSAEAMKAAQQQQQSQRGGGGGLGGMLAGRLLNRGPVEQRSKMLTTTSEFLSIENAVTDADLAIPQGFKEKK
jgi:hypothetical protein